MGKSCKETEHEKSYGHVVDWKICLLQFDVYTSTAAGSAIDFYEEDDRKIVGGFPDCGTTDFVGI